MGVLNYWYDTNYFDYVFESEYPNDENKVCIEFVLCLFISQSFVINALTDCTVGLLKQD